MSAQERDPTLDAELRGGVTTEDLSDFYSLMTDLDYGLAPHLAQRAMDIGQFLLAPDIEQIKVVFVSPSPFKNRAFKSSNGQIPVFGVFSHRFAHTRLLLTNDAVAQTTGLEFYQRDRRTQCKNKWGYLELGPNANEVRYISMAERVPHLPGPRVLLAATELMIDATHNDILPNH